MLEGGVSQQCCGKRRLDPCLAPAGLLLLSARVCTASPSRRAASSKLSWWKLLNC